MQNTDPLRELLLAEGFTLADGPTLANPCFEWQKGHVLARIEIDEMRQRIVLSIFEQGIAATAEIVGPPMPGPQRLLRLLRHHHVNA